MWMQLISSLTSNNHRSATAAAAAAAALLPSSEDDPSSPRPRSPPPRLTTEILRSGSCGLRKLCYIKPTIGFCALFLCEEASGEEKPPEKLFIHLLPYKKQRSDVRGSSAQQRCRCGGCLLTTGSPFSALPVCFNPAAD